LNGAVAQLGERLNGIQEVIGSIPFSSTILVNEGFTENTVNPFIIMVSINKAAYG
jgi:hypothetical protein